MTALDAIAKSEAEAAYRQAEKKLRMKARDASILGQHEQSQYLLSIAHQAGMEFVRNHIGGKPDRWELPGIVVTR